MFLYFSVAMILNLKSVFIILLLLIITGLAVFALTRSHYKDAVSPPGDPATSSVIGQTEMTTDQLIDSLQNYPVSQPSNDPMVVDQQANEAFQAANYATAAELYQRVIELAPHQVEPHNNLGLTLHYLGRSSEALSVLKRGTELDPRYQRTWLTLGFVQSGLGHVEEARQALERAVALGPDTAPGRNASELLGKLP